MAEKAFTKYIYLLAGILSVNVFYYGCATTRMISKSTGMKKNLTSEVDSQGNKHWCKIFGGKGTDYVNSIQPTSDGGYIVAGYKDVAGVAGGEDAWVFKLDENGNQEWDKTFGGKYDDKANSVQQTSDGGYIGVGRTYSLKEKEEHGSDKAWVFKLNNKGGLEWEKTFNGSLTLIQQTSDLGYIGGGCVTPSWTITDVWIFKLDKNGNLKWEKEFPLHWSECIDSIQQTSDSEYIVMGSSPDPYKEDFVWFFKLDKNGEIKWGRQTLAMSMFASKIKDVKKAGNFYIMAGHSGYIVTGEIELKNTDDPNIWILKVDKNGNLEWDRIFGGKDRDYVNSIQPTSDGGYIAAGVTESEIPLDFHAWVFKLDSNGNLEWENIFDGTNLRNVRSIQPIANKEFIMVSSIWSKNRGIGGNTNVLILELDKDGNLDCEMMDKTRK